MKPSLTVIASVAKQSRLWIAASLALLAMTGSVPAHAQDDGMYPPECRLLPDHKASADTAYRPGVDVHGKSVVPADINATPMGLAGQTIVVPLTVDLAKRLGHHIKGLNLDATPGFLEIAPSGRVTYNGQDLTSQVHAVCAGNPQETAAPAAAAPDRQTAPDVIESAPVKDASPNAPVANPMASAQGEGAEGGANEE